MWLFSLFLFLFLFLYNLLKTDNYNIDNNMVCFYKVVTLCLMGEGETHNLVLFHCANGRNITK